MTKYSELADRVDLIADAFSEVVPMAMSDCRKAAAALRELEAERDRLRKPLLWSFIRTLLSQGMSIQQDYDAGKYKDYEEVSARLDAAARERCAALQEGE